MNELRGLLAAVLLLMLAEMARADKPPELPPPRPVPEQPKVEPPVVLVPHGPVNPYIIWQFYAVDRSGAFRERVIYTPYGAFSAYDRRPYPWVTTRPRNFVPRITD